MLDRPAPGNGPAQATGESVVPSGFAETGFAQAGGLLDALPRSIVICDLTGRIVAWNPASEALFGQPATQVLGRSIREVLAAADSDEILRAVGSGQGWQGDLGVPAPAGADALVLLEARPLHDREGVIAAAILLCEDVTQQRLAHRHDKEVADHLQLALSAGDLGTWQWEMSTGAVRWDETMERLYGLEPGTFPGTYEGWLALRRPEDVEAAAAVVSDALITRRPYAIEHRVTWADGSVHWLHGWGRATVDDRGNVTGAIGCTADITARKSLELDAMRRASEVAQLAERDRLQYARLAFLSRISDAALATTDHEAFMAAVTREAVPELGDWCALHYIPEPGAARHVHLAHADPAKVEWAHDIRARHASNPAGSFGVPVVLRTGETEFIPKVDQGYIDRVVADSSIERSEALAIMNRLNLTSMITVPLRTKRWVRGAMQFVTAESAREYSGADLALAEVAAGRIAEALDNMWLTQQQRHIAATLQSALLPPELPDIPGASVAVRYWAAGAATEVGGDFYDVFPIDESSWAVVIGDVCGTGPNAAAVTAIARHAIRAAATHGISPTSVLDWLNDAIIAGKRDRFCTALYLTLKQAEGGSWVITVVSGGHPLPIVARASGCTESIGTPGTLLGVFPVVECPLWTGTLASGDTLVLYTDGVTDVPPPHDLTPEDVERLVHRAAAGGAEAGAVAEALGRAIEDRRGVPERADDIAIVALHLT